MKRPAISIGLPVYNGEKYLAGAIESLLAQSFDDFELIVADNASRDGTEQICREYARQDGRIRYVRNARNIGAGPNFNLTFQLASGRYFKWAAHDDLCAPEFLSRCMDVLENDRGAVLAYTRVTIIDEAGKGLESYIYKLPTDSNDPVVRFRALLQGHMCFEVFGLIRRDALAKTPLMGGYSMGDGVLLARLALIGRFEEIPEALFYSRRHRKQSASLIADRRQYSVWFDPKLRNKVLYPWWRTQFEFFLSIHRSPLAATEKFVCYREVYLNCITPLKRYLLYSELKYGIRTFLGRLLPAVRLQT